VVTHGERTSEEDSGGTQQQSITVRDELKMKKCLICGTPIDPFMSFGKMPLANGFLTQDQFADEHFFELKVAFCSNCGIVQLTEQPDRKKMFNRNYPFFSGTSKLMAVHFQEFAERVKKNYLASKDPFVVEIGSNDGIMLKHFANAGIRHLGIEPSANVAQVAIDNGINTICKFFDEDCARQIVHEYGQVDAFLGANVMCHIPYLHSIVEGIQILLKPDGVVMFEDPYLGDVIEKTTYDQIYDEHVFLFSVSSIQYLFEQHGMEVVDIEPQETHGGSMRYIIAHKGARPVSNNVLSQLEKEKAVGLDRPETYETFRKNCELSRDSLMALLNDVRKQGKRIVGYAATSKSTTIINYCGITTDQIEFICDTTPVKQGKFSPGAHIPVRHYEEFLANYPDYALLFAYNHAKEIMAKEQKFMQSGGKWIVYVPKVQILK
jgi:methylation protein EvaC